MCRRSLRIWSCGLLIALAKVWLGVHNERCILDRCSVHLPELAVE